MSRFGVSVTFLALMAAAPAWAAELTRIASSLEPDDPFGLFLDVGFERTQQRSGITRETHVDGTVRDVRELNFISLDTRLNVSAAIGLYRDLELRFRIPIVFQQDRSWTFASGMTAGASSISNNCLAPNGTLLHADCLTNGTGTQPLFNVPSASYRGGVGNAWET
jgi:hypothetical protein